MEEVWRPVVGYEGYYIVSNLGRVKSVDRIVHHSGMFSRAQKGNELVIRTSSTGHYSTVMLSKENKKKQAKVHRLVAMAFLDNPNNYQEINHKDENKQNNCVDNLEWCDRKYNENYGTKRQRCVAHTDYKKIAMKKSKAVNQMSLDGNIVKIWKSLTEINKELGFSQGNISMQCNGKHPNPLYGFLWRWADEP